MQKLLIIMLGCSLSLNALAAGEMQIAGWRVGCGPAGPCQLVSTTPGVDLRIQRGGVGAPLRMTLNPEGYAGSSNLIVGVDLHPRLALNPGQELLAEADGGSYRIVGQEAKYQLLKQMRDGTRLSITYRNKSDDQIQAEIELRGLVEALAYLDMLQDRRPVAAEPQTPAVLEIPVEKPDPPRAVTARPDHWASQLASLMPAIRGCLEWVPGADQLVDKAWITGVRVTVRSRHRISGERVACVLPIDGKSIEMIDSIDIDAEYLPGEGDPVFTPTGHTRPVGECLDHEAINAADGSPLGWLSFLSC